jgi:hypothetical protein
MHSWVHVGDDCHHAGAQQARVLHRVVTQLVCVARICSGDPPPLPPRTHTHTRVVKHTSPYSVRESDAHVHAHPLSHTHTHARTQALTLVRSDTHPLVHARTHAHTHTLTRGSHLAPFSPPPPPNPPTRSVEPLHKADMSISFDPLRSFRCLEMATLARPEFVSHGSA